MTHLQADRKIAPTGIMIDQTLGHSRGVGSLGLVILLFTSACGSNNPVAPSNPAGPESGSLSATIDGSRWIATSGTLTASYARGTLTMAGTDTSRRTFRFSVLAPGPGSYSLDAPANAVCTAPSGQEEWTADSSNGGTETVRVDRLSPTSGSGTFSFTLVPLPGTGATGMKVVAQGVFDFTLEIRGPDI